MKYYFVSFAYGASEKQMENGIVDIHPIDWQIQCDKQYPGQYTILSWNEITKEQFERYYKHLEVI
jgi:hypothetical protein